MVICQQIPPEAVFVLFEAVEEKLGQQTLVLITACFLTSCQSQLTTAAAADYRAAQSCNFPPDSQPTGRSATF